MGKKRKKEKTSKISGSLDFQVVPKAGLEPARICIRQILSLDRTHFLLIRAMVYRGEIQCFQGLDCHIIFRVILFGYVWYFPKCRQFCRHFLQLTKAFIQPITYFLHILILNVSVGIKGNLDIAVSQLSLNVLEVQSMGCFHTGGHIMTQHMKGNV